MTVYESDPIGSFDVRSTVGLFVFGLGAYFVVRLLLRRTAEKDSTPLQSLPCPVSTLPILGNLLDFAFIHKHRMHDWYTEQSRLVSGKPWRARVMSYSLIVVTSPLAFEDIFKKQFGIFEKGRWFKEAVGDLLGEGIIGAEGESWRQQRRATLKLFTAKMLKVKMDAVIIEKSLKLCQVLTKCAQQGEPVSLKSLMTKLASDVFTKIGLGVELGGLDNESTDVESEHPFIRAVDEALTIIPTRGESPLGWWKVARFLNIGQERKLKKDLGVIRDLVRELMLKSMAKRLEPAPTPVGSAAIDLEDIESTDLLTLLMASHNESDLSRVCDSVMNFFLAGKDTTSFSLSWFMVMMNRHPEVLAKIRAEMRQQLPKLADHEPPTPDDLLKLPYLEAALRESLRLFMPTAYRTANRDTTLSDGTFVPKNTIVVIPMYAAARMTSTWGPDADQYRPERWIDPTTGKVRVVSPFQFITFLAGPRQCLGMSFAMLEMKTVLAMLLSRFDIETVEDPFAITYEYSAVIPVKGRLMVNVRELSASPAF